MEDNKNGKITDFLDVKKLKSNKIHQVKVNILKNPLGVHWKIPILVAKGKRPGPTIGIIAAIHGNELNGLSTIFKLFDDMDTNQLAGTLVAVPIANIPGFLTNQREFSDKKDLNRVFPGKAQGNPSDMYAYNIVQKFVSKVDYLLDLHTASFGRVNSLYVRADLDNIATKQMAMLQNPQIIVNKYDEEGTLRATANNMGIPSITIEIGNPHTFQTKLIDSTFEGIKNLMRYHKMIPGRHRIQKNKLIICERSFWIYSYTGGVLQVFPNLRNRVKKGDIIGEVRDTFGNKISKIISPENGIVIGRNINPVCQSGTRVLHLGILR